MYNKLTNRVRALKSTSGLLPVCTMHVQVLPRMRCAHVVLYVEKCDNLCEVNGEENMTYVKGW